MENELPLLFDARRLCYYTGTVLCLALEQLGLPLRNEFTGATLYEQNCPTETLCADAPEEAALTALSPNISKSSKRSSKRTGRHTLLFPAKLPSAATTP